MVVKTSWCPSKTADDLLGSALRLLPSSACDPSVVRARLAGAAVPLKEPFVEFQHVLGGVQYSLPGDTVELGLWYPTASVGEVPIESWQEDGWWFVRCAHFRFAQASLALREDGLVIDFEDRVPMYSTFSTMVENHGMLASIARHSPSLVQRGALGNWAHIEFEPGMLARCESPSDEYNEWWAGVDVIAYLAPYIGPSDGPTRSLQVWAPSAVHASEVLERSIRRSV